MKTILLALTILLFSVSYGQDAVALNNPDGKASDIFFVAGRKWDPKLCIKAAPLSLLGIYAGPSARLGVEFKLKDSWSLYHEIGYFFAYKPGVITKLELKHYFEDQDEPDENSGGYLSGELYYKYQSFNASDSIQIAPEYEKNYSVSKHVECFTFKYGYMKVYPCGIVVDMFAGIGIRVKQAKNTLTAEENDHIAHSSDYGPNVFTNEAGNKVYPNIDLGVKVGYRFRRKL